MTRVKKIYIQNRFQQEKNRINKRFRNEPTKHIKHIKHINMIMKLSLLRNTRHIAWGLIGGNTSSDHSDTFRFHPHVHYSVLPVLLSTES